ncbi:MAG: class I SAM-dependent methyltransferase [Acidimicrobiales bacterium]
MEKVEATFSAIYRDGVWTGGSGSGSHPANTASYRSFLQRFLRDEMVRSVLDVGCGDWQSSRLVDWTGVDYLGVDAVASVVETNRHRYETASVRFQQLDVLHDPLPMADLVLVKDVFQHWPNQVIAQFATRLAAYRHVLVTNTVDAHPLPSAEPIAPALAVNEDIEMGDMRPVDLAVSPFNWPVVEVHQHRSVRWRARMVEDKATVLLLNTPLVSQ